MDIGNRIKQLREKQGFSQQTLAEKVGFKTASAVNKIELGLRDISQTKIVLFAKALNTTPAYLMGWEDQDDIYQYKNVIPVPPMKKIPLVGTIACGAPILAAENIECEVNMPENINADFALRCKGDSMIEAHIYDGDIVYIRKQPVVENGEIAAVLIEDEATLKRFYKSGDTITLMACNASFLPLVYTSKDHVTIQILGKAVGFTSTNV